MSRSFRSRVIAAPLLAASLALAPAVGVGIATQAVAADFDSKYGENYDVIKIYPGMSETILGPRGFKQGSTYKEIEGAPDWIHVSSEGSGNISFTAPEDLALGNLVLPVIVNPVDSDETEIIYARFRVVTKEDFDNKVDNSPDTTTVLGPSESDSSEAGDDSEGEGVEDNGEGTEDSGEGAKDNGEGTEDSGEGATSSNEDSAGSEDSVEGTSTEPQPDTEESGKDSTETTVTSLPADSASTSGTSADSGRPVLASTGANVGSLAIIAILLTLGGASFMAYRRKIG